MTAYGMGPTGLNPTTTAAGSMKEKIPSGYKKGSIQQFTPEQMQLFQQLFGNLGPESFLSKLAGGDQGTFEQIELPALQQFSGLQEGIANKYSGAGLGARHSSGFQNAQTSAASQFAQQLQANRLGLQQQALRDLFGLSSNLLGQRPFETTLTEKPKSGWQSFLSSLGGGLGQGVSSDLFGGF